MENRVEEQELAVAEGTGGTATAGTDYAALSSGTLTFAVGDTSETVTVSVTGDTTDEPNETVVVALSGPTNATVSSTTGAGTGTITDDDGEPPLSTDSAPTTLSMADVEAKEGKAAAFLPTLSPPPPQPMMVTCITAPVTATEGKDYEHVTGLRLAIAAGRGSVRVTAPTVDDEIPEPDETFTLRIVPDRTAVASFGRTLASFGRTVASEAVNVIDERLADAQAAGSSVTLGGHGLLPSGRAGAAVVAPSAERMESDGLGRDAPPRRVAAAGGGRPSAREAAMRSAFSVSFGPPPGEAGFDAPGGWTVWGRMAGSGFSGRPESGLSVEGDVFSGYLGLDAWVDDDFMLGMALSHSEGDMSYELPDGRGGEVDAALASVLPYGRWTPRADLGVWGMLGAGWGDAKLVDGFGAARTRIEMRMLALGWRKELRGAEDAEGAEWALKGDGFVMGMESDAAPMLPATRSKARRLRVAVEGAWEWRLGTHGRLHPKLELGGRWDGGRVETGYGMEAGGGLEFADPRLGVEVEARGRYLLAHRSEGFRERGASMALRFDPGGDGAGPWIGLASRWGAPEGGVRSLWGSLPGGVGGGAAAVGSASTLGLEAGYRSTKPLDMGLTVGLEKESGASGSFGAILRSTIRW